jgi:hypothetical protein
MEDLPFLTVRVIHPTRLITGREGSPNEDELDGPAHLRLSLPVRSVRPRSRSRGPGRALAAVPGEGYLTRTSFMMRPAAFQSWTYRLPSLSQDEP